MGLVVQHNITALNANRQLGVTSSAQAKSTEKLSSGYRINRAGDDAAGLTISEKMRSQIRGLDKASTNAQDGISLIQSAEGALNEAHSILQRMNELAVQGANDTNQNIDRDAINEELKALTEELDRIAETTQFNKQNLLDGSFKDKSLQIGANAGQSLGISIEAMNADAIGLGKESITTNSQVTKLEYNGISVAYNSASKLSKNAATLLSNVKKDLSSNFVSANVEIRWTGSKQEYVVKFGGTSAAVSTFSKAKATYTSKAKIKASQDILTNNKFNTEVSTWKSFGNLSNGMPIQYGARVDDKNIANNTISKVQQAINKVSEQRSALGALQNRLEHTVANLDTVSENTSAAESRIRDTDMAKEMVNYSKNNILAQAGQSMLAQANQSTQGVLSLLQ